MDCSKICRLCAECRHKSQLQPFTEQMATELFRCTRISVDWQERPVLPQSVCVQCISELKVCLNFTETVTKAQKKLEAVFARNPFVNPQIKVDSQHSADFSVDAECVVDLKYIKREDPLELGACSMEWTETASSIVGLDADITDQRISIVSDESIEQSTETTTTETITETVTESNAAAGKEWGNAIKYIRKQLNISDEDYNGDGTINVKNHPEWSDHSWKNYKWRCAKCDELFDTVGLLEQHIDREHDVHRIKYGCGDCQMKSNCVNNVKLHIFRAHKARQMLRLCCDHCNTFYWCNNAFRKHRATVDDAQTRGIIGDNHGPSNDLHQCSVCGELFELQIYLIKHEKFRHSMHQGVCQYCEEVLLTKVELKYHCFTVHADIFRFKCHFCEERYTYSNDLGKHERKVHGRRGSDDNAATPPCSICDAVIASDTELHEHMKTHIQNGHYTCIICNKGYQKLSALKRHMAEHSEGDSSGKSNRPKCSYCEKEFSNYAEYTKHMEIHIDGRMYKCHFCTKRFPRPERLRIHISAHTGQNRVTCEICGLRLSGVDALKSHKKNIHSDERPHECEFCGRKFKSPGNLKHHRFKHTGERPFTCTLCEPHHHFTRRGNYNVHMQRYHDIDSRVQPKTILIESAVVES